MKARFKSSLPEQFVEWITASTIAVPGDCKILAFWYLAPPDTSKAL
jgi:hypothetical protein